MNRVTYFLLVISTISKSRKNHLVVEIIRYYFNIFIRVSGIISVSHFCLNPHRENMISWESTWHHKRDWWRKGRSKLVRKLWNCIYIFWWIWQSWRVPWESTCPEHKQGKQGEAAIYSNLGIVFKRLGEYDKAKNTCHQKGIADKWGRGSLYGNLVTVTNEGISWESTCHQNTNWWLKWRSQIIRKLKNCVQFVQGNEQLIRSYRKAKSTHFTLILVPNKHAPLFQTRNVS